ncbi:hypothetical protein AHF37_00812 [Paragonimus kellicotti]|nr:hypothetical protein AHF37_00812 [Paragonimus kellicotti]
MVDDYVYRRLATVQQVSHFSFNNLIVGLKRLDEARRYSEPYPDWRLLAYMTESEKRYKMAYEALMTKKNPPKKKGRESSKSPDARGESDVLMRMLLMQQFQQQSSMWQMALMQMLNRREFAQKLG